MRHKPLSPQEMARVLLTLCSNGFYATRKREAAEPGFRSALRLVTGDIGDAVEIKVRDNGIGVPEDIRDKLFSPSSPPRRRAKVPGSGCRSPGTSSPSSMEG
jgi:signal transduction histidine kinase